MILNLISLQINCLFTFRSIKYDLICQVNTCKTMRKICSPMCLILIPSFLVICQVDGQNPVDKIKTQAGQECIVRLANDLLHITRIYLKIILILTSSLIFSPLSSAGFHRGPSFISLTASSENSCPWLFMILIF